MIKKFKKNLKKIFYFFLNIGYVFLNFVLVFFFFPFFMSIIYDFLKEIAHIVNFIYLCFFFSYMKIDLIVNFFIYAFRNNFKNKNVGTIIKIFQMLYIVIRGIFLTFITLCILYKISVIFLRILDSIHNYFGYKNLYIYLNFLIFHMSYIYTSIDQYFEDGSFINELDNYEDSEKLFYTLIAILNSIFAIFYPIILFYFIPR